jgi:signal transduction histidine kinase
MYHGISASASWPESGALSVQNEGGVMIGRQLGDTTLVAISQHKMPEMFGRQRVRTEALMISVLVSGISAIAIISILSLLFSRWQIKRIMRPINALTDAAKRVESGDLSTPVAYQGRDEFTAVCTAFDHMQRHLLSEREKNAAYEKARTDLVAGISHDLRTPLTSVKGYIKGLRDGVANTPEKQARYLDIAYRKSCDMDQLLQRLFYFSKLETGNLPLFMQRKDLGLLISRFADEAREEIEPLGGQVFLSVDGPEHPVRVDEEQFYRVLNNLKENAVRYAGAEALELRLSVSWRNGKEYLRFSDNGQGVPEDQLSHLFEQFWRGDQARGSRSGEGSGLGLYVSKYIIEAHGGTIQASNDHGLTFEIALPHCDETEDEHE